VKSQGIDWLELFLENGISWPSVVGVGQCLIKCGIAVTLLFQTVKSGFLL